MNQRHLQNIFHVSVDVGLMVENGAQYKNKIMVSVSVSIKNQYNIAYAKKIMLGLLVHVLASVIVRVKDW